MRPKLLLLFLPLFLLAAVSVHLARAKVVPAKEFSDATVAQRIIQDSGYQMFHFTPKTTQRYVLIVRIKGVDNTRLHIGASKQYIVTVQQDEQLGVKSVRVDSGSEMISATGDNPRKYSSSLQKAVVAENEPFLTLDGPDGKLEILMASESA